jgi:hypothetical protein
MLHEFGLGRTIEATRIEDDRKKAMCIADALRHVQSVAT